MNIPQNLKYTKDHEWALIEGNTATIGITDHAQGSLGDVVFVDLPKVGRELKLHETFGVVESIKAVSDLYSPLAGKVVAINDAAVSNPAVVNTSPYGDAWLIKIEMTGTPSDLLSAEQYSALLKTI